MIKTKYIMVMDKGIFFDYPVEVREEDCSLFWTAFMGVSANWPFLVYQGVENKPHCIYIWIVNVND